jgi:hypothetical protein
MKIFVALWEHRHGRDVRVFKNEEGARIWRHDIAIDNWELKIERMPDTPELVADRYFEIMDRRGCEWFTIEACEIES